MIKSFSGYRPFKWILKRPFWDFSLSLNQQHNQSLWAIAWMSFFSGIASVMVFSILSLFMTEELHLSYKQVGYIEGVAVAVAFGAKIFSGIISDKIRKRKKIIIIGTIFSIIIKPIFALATGLYGVFLAKSLDRLAKGVRAAPTEALIADLSDQNRQGISYGTRYTLYAAGFMVGGGLSSYLMGITHNNFRLVFWLALIPALVALLILIIFIKDPFQSVFLETDSPLLSDIKYKEKTKINFSFHLSDFKMMPKSFWHIMIATFFLMLARFSESFLHYRGRELGYAISTMPLFMMFYNLIEALAPMPIGKLADRMDKRKLFLIGIFVLVLANMTILLFSSHIAIVISVALAGLHMGMTQGLIGTLVASSTPAHLKGTGFAILYLVIGIAAPFSNFMAGHLADYSKSLGFGVQGAFAWGGIVTTLSVLYLWKWIQSDK